MDVRTTEIYKRIVTDKIVHYLNEVLIETAVCNDLDLRLDQARKLLRPIDLDDIAINRCSMGYCGWLNCAEPAPTKRCLALLCVILQKSLDEDVIDSFHSLECFEKFMAVRKTLDPSISQLRTAPDQLAQEFIDKRLASSNINLLIKDAKVEEIIRPGSKKVISCGSLSSDTCERPLKTTAQQSSARNKSNTKSIRKRVSFKDPEEAEEDKEPHAKPSHPAKRTDVASSSDDWKAIPKSVAITMSQTTTADLFRYDYESAAPKVVEKIQKPITYSTDSGELEFFTSMNDLLNCSFDDEASEDYDDDDRHPY